MQISCTLNAKRHALAILYAKGHALAILYAKRHALATLYAKQYTCFVYAKRHTPAVVYAKRHAPVSFQRWSSSSSLSSLNLGTIREGLACDFNPTNTLPAQVCTAYGLRTNFAFCFWLRSCTFFFNCHLFIYVQRLIYKNGKFPLCSPKIEYLFYPHGFDKKKSRIQCCFARQ